MIPVEIENLKYPIGKFNAPNEYSPEMIRQWIQSIDEIPSLLRSAVKGLDDKQLDTPYREGGWTVRQVIHHLADSHMNAYIRFKLTMTEDTPVIKPYIESRWAELEEAKHASVEISLSLLEALHRRWVLFLRSMKEEDFGRKYHHPESKRDFELWTVLALYAWHGVHHLTHITALAKREGWSPSILF